MTTRNTGEERQLGIGWFRFERRDGPRYAEAIRGALEMRRERVERYRGDLRMVGESWGPEPPRNAWPSELAYGIPAGWSTRP